jgi:hypothetical protein
LLDLVGGIACDFDQAVEDKIEVNRNRSWRHGGRRL